MSDTMEHLGFEEADDAGRGGFGIARMRVTLRLVLCAPDRFMSWTVGVDVRRGLVEVECTERLDLALAGSLSHAIDVAGQYIRGEREVPT